MTKKFSKEECISIYERFVSHATISVNRGKTDYAYNDVKAAARWAYHFNWIYNDVRLDNIIRRIGRLWSKPFELKLDGKKRYLLIDTHGVDNRGLTQQYMRALMAMEAEFLFVSVEPNVAEQRDIRSELAAYPRASTLFLDNKKMMPRQRLEIIVDVVKQYQPQVAIGHIFPWDPIPFMLFDLARGMKIYNINFTDHAFWIGSSFIDYNIEFRAYGMTLSLEARHLQIKQIICLPYYPIKPIYEPFHGFPDLPKDSIKIFTGGSFYKMMGDNDLFFKLCDSLLDLSPRVVLLVAGPGDDSQVRGKISTMRNSTRVYLIGDRRDVNEVVKHCDLYLNTYPLIGGLMSQYAAANSKPILTYGKEHKVEGVVNHFSNNVKTFFSIEELLAYARRCIDDENFRIEEGKKNKIGVMDEEKFNSIFCEIFNDKYVDYFHWDKMSIDYDVISNLYLDVENNYSNTAFKILFSSLKIRALFMFPQYTLYFFSTCIHEGLKFISKKFHVS